MKNLKCRATLSYAYHLGDIVVQNVTNSNFVQPELREINIRVRKFANTSYFKPGDIISYTIVISNDGSSDAKNIIIKEPLKYQSLIKESIKIRSIDEKVILYEESKDEVTFTLESLSSLSTIYLTYQTIIDEIIDIAYNISASSKVITEDTKIESNKVELMQRFARIICEKKTDTIIYPNKPFAIEIVIENVGNEKAVNLDLVDQLPDRYCLHELYIDKEQVTNYLIEGNNLKYFLGEIEPFSKKVVTLVGLIKKI